MSKQSICGVHSIQCHGLTWKLEAPDVMCIIHDDTLLLHWNEAEGYVRYHEDDTQTEYDAGEMYGVVMLPPTQEAECIIDELRRLDGVVY